MQGDSHTQGQGVGVDIPRARARRLPRRLIDGGLALLGVVQATVVLRSLEPAAPQVDRAAVGGGR